MTTENQQMLSALGALADDLTGKLGQIDAKVNSLIPSVAGTLVKTIWVDPVNGDDDAPGSGEYPVKTLAGAAALTSNAGAYTIYLRGDVVVDERITFKGTSIYIASDELHTKRRMDWASQIDNVSTLSPSLRAGNLFMNFTFRDIVFGNTTAAAHIEYKRMIEAQAFLNLDSWICEFDTQAGDDLPFVVSNAQVALWMLSATIPAEQAGLWINNVAPGTDPATVSHIINTNLASL